MRNYEVTRISINPQSMNDDTLKLIGRGHNVSEVKEKFELARSLGFNDINMDIIIGLPGEGIDQVKNTCNEILKLAPDSLTVHGLSLKRASILYENFILSTRKSCSRYIIFLAWRCNTGNNDNKYTV